MDSNYHGFPEAWLMNWIKPNFKAGDKNQESIYCTIIVSSTIAKLYSTIMEQKVSAWAESQNKRALGQASFRPKHSTLPINAKSQVVLKLANPITLWFYGNSGVDGSSPTKLHIQ